MDKLYSTLPMSDEVIQIRTRRLDEARAMLKERVEMQMRANRSQVVQRRANRIAFQLRRAMA